MTAHGFGLMRPSDSSYAITLYKNREAIEHGALACQRTNVADYVAHNRMSNDGARKLSKLLSHTATTLRLPWLRGVGFVSCVRALPADQAAPVWQAALAEVTATAGRR